MNGSLEKVQNVKCKIKNWLSGLRIKIRQSVALGLVIALFTVFVAPKPVLAAAGDGLIVYGEGTVATPRYRTWTSSAWSGESSAQSAAATINFAVMKTKPGATERIMATLGTAASSNLVVQRWNGSAWSSQWTATNAGNTYRGVDIAYENLSGRAMVVYSDGDTTPQYQIWNGSTWTSGTITLSTGVGTIRWVRLATKLNSNEIVAVFLGSNTTGTNVNAQIWDGSNWGTEPSGGLGLDVQNGYDSFDAVYETNYASGSRNLMVAWATAGTTPYWAYATHDGTSWTKVTTPPAAAGDDIFQLALAASPLDTSNRIAMANMDFDFDLNAACWDGTTDTWTATVNVDISCTAYLVHNVDVAFAGTTDNAILVYGDLTATTNIDWARSVAGGAWTVYHNAATTGTEVVCNVVADASSNKIMYTMVNSSVYLYAYVYNEDDQSWTITDGGAALETSSSGGGTTSTAKESFAFAYESVYSIPTLGMALTFIAVASFIAVLVRRRILKLRRVEA